MLTVATDRVRIRKHRFCWAVGPRSCGWTTDVRKAARRTVRAETVRFSATEENGGVDKDGARLEMEKSAITLCV